MMYLLEYRLLTLFCSVDLFLKHYANSNSLLHNDFTIGNVAFLLHIRKLVYSWKTHKSCVRSAKNLKFYVD